MSKNGKNQNSAGNLAKSNKSSSKEDTKLQQDTFDLQPRVNPSNMMSSNADSNQGTTHKKYN